MKILVATDASAPQVNGVVTTYRRLAEELPRLGVSVSFLTPESFQSIRMPGYREIRLAVPSRTTCERQVAAAGADHIHIATEGPVGWMVRNACLRRGTPFTTSFHTRFPEYAAHHFGFPRAPVYAALRHFHNAGAGTMVAAPSLRRELAQNGFRNVQAWTRGVDTDVFFPRQDRLFGDGRPVFLYVGRVSVEKNIDAFLSAELPGKKVVVGDGPHLDHLARRYPGVHFAGRRTGDDLARHFASADVFVFPSRTDTFGLVLLEAMASGVPVAAYPVTGPADVVEDGISGILDLDLATAARRALTLDRSRVRESALRFTWRRAAEMFVANIRHARSAATAKPVVAAVPGRLARGEVTSGAAARGRP